jgi:hypothetical protein
MRTPVRYEVQVRLAWGWTKAGNWPARTKAEGLKSLTECASMIDGGATHDYRLVRLAAEPIKVRRATKRFDKRSQRYVSIKTRLRK